MIVASRPIRFLMLTIGGWIAVRTISLWPAAEALPDLIRVIAPPAVAAAVSPRANPPVVTGGAPYAPGDSAAGFARASPSIAPTPGPPATIVRAAAPLAFAAAPIIDSVDSDLAQPVATPGSDAPPVFVASRFSGSAWAIARPDGRATPFASQLGGSQTGIRLAYAIDQARRLAVTARFSSALDTRQREAAIGLDWKPTRLPIHVVVEHRIGIEEARGGPAIGAIGGVGPTLVGAGFRFEAYGQTGVIARDGGEAFADGSMRLARPIARRDRATLDIGVGGWGGAQRGAARLDIGPSIGATLPVGRRSLRLSADWRQRVAGNARPNSGPALSIGTDF